MARSTEGSVEADLATQFNKLVDDVELIRARVVALATAATQSSSVTAIATAGTLTAGKIGDSTGTAL